MQKLGKREEQIMQVIWRLENAFIKDIIEEMPEPKPSAAPTKYRKVIV